MRPNQVYSYAESPHLFALGESPAWALALPWGVGEATQWPGWGAKVTQAGCWPVGPSSLGALGFPFGGVNHVVIWSGGAQISLATLCGALKGLILGPARSGFKPRPMPGSACDPGQPALKRPQLYKAVEKVAVTVP